MTSVHDSRGLGAIFGVILLTEVICAAVPYYRAPERSPRSSLDLPVPAGYKELTDLCLCPLSCHLPGWPSSICFCLGKIDFHLAPVYSRACVHSAGEGDRCKSKCWGSEVYNTKVINLIKISLPSGCPSFCGSDSLCGVLAVTLQRSF